VVAALSAWALLSSCKEKARAVPAIEVPPAEPTTPLTEVEQKIAGTWVATVDEQATRTKAFDDKVVLGLDPSKKDMVDSIGKAIASDNRLATNCIWLELYTDRTGFRNECAIVAGEPSALENTDPLTGVKSPFGVKFRWEVEDEQLIKLSFSEELYVPAKDAPGGRHPFRSWHLRFVKQSGDKIQIKEHFPEPNFTLATTYGWEIFPGRYLGTNNPDE
jgi:hypothetical protein